MSNNESKTKYTLANSSAMKMKSSWMRCGKDMV